MRTWPFLIVSSLIALAACDDKAAIELDDSGSPESTPGTTVCGSTEGFISGSVLGPFSEDPNPNGQAWASNAAGLFEQAETDGAGGYELNLPEGAWTVRASDGDECRSQEHEVEVVACEEIVLDLTLDECDTTTSADKPNIYLYPSAATPTRVSLLHDPRQEVFASDPPYGQRGWRGVAHPDGTFSQGGRRAPFLFYEITLLPWQNRGLQRKEGWCVPEAGAVHWMAELLGLYGFDSREQEDFVDGWIHDLPRNPGGYAVYPQQVVDELADVVITPALPLSRLWLLVEDGSGCPARNTPVILPFDRSGPHAVEWGVVLNDLVR